MSDRESRDWIEQAIQAAWGERCPDTDPECAGCRVWTEWDRLVGSRVAALREALGICEAHGDGRYCDGNEDAYGITTGADYCAFDVRELIRKETPE